MFRTMFDASDTIDILVNNAGLRSVHEVIPWAGHANCAASKSGVMLLMKAD